MILTALKLIEYTDQNLKAVYMDQILEGLKIAKRGNVNFNARLFVVLGTLLAARLNKTIPRL